MRLFLCGLPGIGKSTCGKLLADALGWPFVDLDECIERLFLEQEAIKLTCREIYRARSPRLFRQLETTALSSIHKHDPCVISLGGGALESLCNRTLVRKLGYLIYLKGGTRTVWKQLAARELPAYLNPLTPRGALEELARRRIPQFKECCDLTIGVDEMTPQEILERIMEKLPLNCERN